MTGQRSLSLLFILSAAEILGFWAIVVCIGYLYAYSRVQHEVSVAGRME